MEELKGQIAVVTGSSRGIGKGTAIALGEKGCTVYVTGRTAGDGDRTISLLYRAFEEGFTRSDLLEDSVFDFIRADERFVQLTALLGN